MQCGDAAALDGKILLELKNRCGVEKAAVAVAEAKAAFFEGWSQRAWRLAENSVAEHDEVLTSTGQQQRCLPRPLLLPRPPSKRRLICDEEEEEDAAETEIEIGSLAEVQIAIAENGHDRKDIVEIEGRIVAESFAESFVEPSAAPYIADGAPAEIVGRGICALPCSRLINLLPTCLARYATPAASQLPAA